MLPDVYDKAVLMLDKYVAAVDAASVTPVFLDQSTNPVVVQSNHTDLVKITTWCVEFVFKSFNWS